jgi:putative hemolysin
LRKTRIEELAEKGRRGARSVLALKNDPERFLATVQVGITVVGSTAAAFGGGSVATRLAPQLERISWIGESADVVALSLVIASISYLSIVVGELVPKSLALRSAEAYALLVASTLVGLSWLARPLVWFLSASANLILRPFGDKTTFTETRHSAEELQELVEQAAQGGTIRLDVGEIASRALDLPGLTAADVMVPRRQIIGIPRDASTEEIRRIILEHPFTRLPVYEDQIDKVVGYVSVRDMLPLAWDRKPIVLAELMREPYFVPGSKRALELMKEMRSQHAPFTIVVDEQGGTSGIVTVEDLVEELVGEIFSEHAREAPQLIKKESDGSVLVNGLTHIREINRALGIELSENRAWTTVAGLCLAIAGRIPAIGEVIDVAEGIRVQIVDASPRRIRTVKIFPPNVGAH